MCVGAAAVLTWPGFGFFDLTLDYQLRLPLMLCLCRTGWCVIFAVCIIYINALNGGIVPDFDTIGFIVEVVAGVATAVGVLFALGDTVFRAHKQGQDNKRQQATKILSWYEDGRDEDVVRRGGQFVLRHVLLQNGSETPVYNVVVTCVGFQGAGPALKGEDNPGSYPCRVCVGVLPPGLWLTQLPTYGSGMHVVAATEIAFTDANGVSWVRRGNGRLEEAEDPISFYCLERPLEWKGCSRVE